MPVVTCIDDLRRLAKKRCRAGDLRVRRPRLVRRGDAARQPRRPRVARRCASASASTSTGRSHAHHHARRRRWRCRWRSRRSASPGSTGPTARSSPRAPRSVRHPVHPLDHVDLLDRGRRQDVDKPFWFQLYVMRDRGFAASLIERAKAAKCSRAGAHPRPAGPGPAPPGPEERPRGAAQADAAELSLDIMQQTLFGRSTCCGKEEDPRQPRGPHPRREEPDHAVAVDRRPVRPDAVLEGRRVGEEASGAASW